MSRRAVIAIACAVFAASVPAKADAIPPLGAELAAVEKALGQPQGLIDLGSKVLLLYPRGKLVFDQGRLSEIDFISTAELKVREADTQRAAEEATRQRELRRAAGQSAWEALSTDPDYPQLSGTAQLARLAAFQARHPGVDIQSAVLLARQKAGEEAWRHRLLAAQTAEAEARAREARARAQKFERRENTGLQSYTYAPWPVHYPRPVIAIAPGARMCPPANRPVLIIRR